MSKKSKIIYVIGSVIIGALAVLCVYFVLMATGVIAGQKPKVIIATSGSTKEYDGTPLTNENWQLVSGELQKGHNVEVVVTGKQEVIGTSSNLFSVKITDKKGRDVTDDYAVEYLPGELAITKRVIEITVDSEEKTYDGMPLYAESFDITKGVLLEGHTLEGTVEGERTRTGTSEASANCKVVNSDGEEVVGIYELVILKGNLTVNPIEIVVQAGSDAKVYDGDPLTCDRYSVVSVEQLLDGHDIQVSIVGSITEIGEEKNIIVDFLITDEYGEDVTDCYDVTCLEGVLEVLGNQPWGGGGGLNLDDSGNIGLNGGGGGGGNSAPAFKVLSDRSGTVYFRYFSYTDYNGRRWTNPKNGYYNLIDGTYCANYLTSIALQNAGFSASNIEIEMLSSNYLLPYYMAMGDYEYQKQTNDVQYLGDCSSPYSLGYYSFNYVQDKEELTQVNLGSYQNYENEYRNYVYDKYLGVPESSATYLQTVISQNGFDKNDGEIVGKVATYIRKAATYNLEYDREMDNAEDILVAFLRDYKEGICQHYALSATMLFRQLGIPARCTIGYTAKTQKDVWVTVGGDKAHAWVEVYIDGLGWVNVEVTGGGNGLPPLGEFTIEAKSKSVCIEDQSVIEASEVEYVLKGFDEFMSQGYNCEVVLTGRQEGIGRSKVELGSVKVVDIDGEDVTDRFVIEFKTAYMSIYAQKITIMSGSNEKVYDGTPLTSSTYTIVNGNLLEGHSISVTPISSITDVGEMRNSVDVVINDILGEDVSHFYFVIVVQGKLTVTPQQITIQAGSASKPHDGTPLTCSEYILYDKDGYEIQSLGDGITIEVKMEGSIIECGRCDNVVISVVIKNASGQDITSNYQIGTENGQLRVTKS